MLKIITRIKDTQNNNCISQNIKNKNINNMKSNKWLILLTLIFGMGFNGGVVYGSAMLETPKSKKTRLQEELTKATPTTKPIIKAELEEMDGKYSGDKMVPRTPDSKKVVQPVREVKISDQPIPMLLMDQIRSGLRSREMIEFIDKYIFGSFLKKSNTEEVIIPNARTVQDNFLAATSATFFEKISGIGGQISLKEDAGIFASQEAFFLSKTMPAEIRNDALTVVRTVMDFGFGEEIQDGYGVTPKLLTKRIRRLFWGSRKFLQDQAVEQIPDFSMSFASGVNSYGFVDRALYFSDGTAVVIGNKKGGDEFGEILSLKVEDRTVFSYFIKAYTGYPAKRGRNGSTDLSSSSGQISGAESGDAGGFSLPKLREPFVYKVLESLGIGSTTAFVVNPYMYGGFYIATRGLTYARQTFMEVDKLDKPLVDRINKMEDYSSFAVNLTGIDFIGRIMRLNDLNKSNFGFVLGGSNEFECSNFIDRISELVPFIIDFRVGNFDEEYQAELGHNFLSGNTTINYGDGSVMAKVLKNKPEQEKFFFGFQALQQFRSRIIQAKEIEPLDFPDLVVSQVLEGEEDDDKIDTKFRSILALQAQHIKNLMLQHRYDLPILRNRTHAELIGFKSRGNVPRPTEEPLNLEYIEDAFEDLDNYCQGIMCNYKTLKKFIADGYREYFDEQGNPRVQPPAPVE